MELPRVLLYVVGRMVAGLTAGFGLAFDYTGDSVLTISPRGWGLIGLVAFGVFLVLTLVRELDLAFQQRPKIRVNPVIHNGRAILEVHNTGGSATFIARARILTEPLQPELYTMYWESEREPHIRIEAKARAPILVAEAFSFRNLTNHRNWHIFRLGTSGEQHSSFPLPCPSEILIEVSISSDPALREPFDGKVYELRQTTEQLGFEEHASNQEINA